MAPTKFLQLHYLTSFPGTLLNRDDSGLAKRLPFGGASRIRISSQCLKRHWRTAQGEHSLASLGMDMSVRSRAIFEREILDPLVGEGLDRGAVSSILGALQNVLLGASDRKRKAAQAADDEEPNGAEPASRSKKDSAAGGKKVTDLATSQVIVLGRPEIDYIKQTARALVGYVLATPPGERSKKAVKIVEEHVKTGKKANTNLGIMSAGLDAALFGRMVTSDILARGDAAIHVAHAFTVHAEEAESDYFSAVDDLLAADRELGSGHIGETELTSGVYYGYVVVDVPLLVSNLQGCRAVDWMSADRKLAAGVCRNLVHLIATVSPGAKRGSTAPYSFADLVIVESGTRLPRTLANAFLRAVPPQRGTDVREAAVEALAQHLTSFDRMYGRREERRVASVLDVAALPADNAGALDALGEWAAGQVERSA